MSDLLFWRFVESTPGHCAPFCEWRLRFGDGRGFAAIQKSLLQVTGELAASVPCATDCGAGCPRKVVEEMPRSLVAVCPEREAPPYSLQEKDTLMVRLKYVAVHRQISRLLGLTGDSVKVPGCPHTWRLGDYVPEAGFAYPVFLHIPDPEGDVTGIVRTLCLGHNEFVMLLPTRERLSAEANDLLRRHQTIFLALAEEFRVGDDGLLVLNRDAGVVLDGLRRRVPAANDTTLTHFPTPAGAAWQDLRISCVYGDSHSVSIRIGGVAGQYTCAQMGMASKRNGKPTKQWQVLRALAESRGTFSWRNQKAHRTIEKQKQQLSQRLRAFFRIDGDPIPWDSKGKCYQCLFDIHPEGDDV